MADFQELIKNFNRIRDYMRQFYVYGYKVRSDFDEKSARTYDNERRRIESWLSKETRADYTSKGKHVYINVDSKTISQNPLYAAWKAKSFTDNDILLHFFILDLLSGHRQGMTAPSLSDQISETFGMVFDSQTVRLKLKEYEKLGLLQSRRDGKQLFYSLTPPLPIETEQPPSIWNRLLLAVKFYQGAAPLGFIGKTILDRNLTSNEWFQFKHHFIVHTLEDEILLNALSAMHSQCAVDLVNKSSRSKNISAFQGVPLKIFVSTRTGRRYLCLYLPEKRRFHNFRLDNIQNLTVLEKVENYPLLLQKLIHNLPACWGVSFGNRSSREEQIYIKLKIDETKEPYILNRLYREGRGGEITHVMEHEYLYSAAFFDTNEMLSWVKSFTGRITDIMGSNQLAVAKIIRDWDQMYKMYCTENQTEENQKDGTL